MIPPRQEAAAPVREKMKRGEPLTQEEQRLLILALPRKTRRAHGIRTTNIREELNALVSMADPALEKAAGVTPLERGRLRNKAKAARRRSR
jgi:hypothetical protein